MNTNGEYLLQSILKTTPLSTLNLSSKMYSVAASPLFPAWDVSNCWTTPQQSDSFLKSLAAEFLPTSGVFNSFCLPNLNSNSNLLLQILQTQQILQSQQEHSVINERNSYKNLLLSLALFQPSAPFLLASNKDVVENDFLLSPSLENPLNTFPKKTIDQTNKLFEQIQQPISNNKTDEQTKLVDFSALSSASTSRDSTPPTTTKTTTMATDFYIDVLNPKEFHENDKKIKRKRKEIMIGERESPNTIKTEKSETIHPCKKRAKLLKKRLHSQDIVTNSPVSGMFIKDACTADELQKAAELDDTASYVHISKESRQRLSEIPNVIGDSICSLCKVKFEDVFRLAMHRCPRIIHEEYRCPECDKIFSCPANLASHRRWHKPKAEVNETDIDGRNNNSGSGNEETLQNFEGYICAICFDTFSTKKALKYHKKHGVCVSCPPSATSTTPTADKKLNIKKISIDTSKNKLNIYNAKIVEDDSHFNNLNSSRSVLSVAAAALISLGVSPQKKLLKL